MQYTTLATLKTYLWIDWDWQDAVLTNVIKRATAQFDKYLGRNLQKTTYTEYISCEDDKMLVANFWPVASVVSITYDDESGATIDHQRVDGNIVWLKNEVDGTVCLKYEGGYTNLDAIPDIEQACLEVCKDLWDNTPASGNESNIKSKQIETLSKTYFSKDEMAGGIGVSFRETLDNYKIFNPLIV